MIAKIEFGYEAQQKFPELVEDPEVYEKLRSIIIGAPSVQHKNTYYNWPRETILDTETDGPYLLSLGLTFSVTQIKGTLPLESILPGGTKYTVNVQVPHIGLLMIDEVKLEENCCTDKLQGLLDEGWRLLCVCPPNAQRRPDYILGRSKGEKS